jgi:DNA-3-methyladenine glycosylase I
MTKGQGANVRRCAWTSSEINLAYHDREWGVPCHDDRVLFEFLLLEGAQAGLTWELILKRREGYRRAFSKFDPKLIAKYDARKVAALLADPSIIRNRLKIRSSIQNAKAFLAVQKEFGSFDAYLWRFVGGRPVRNRWKSFREIPVLTPEATAMSKDLKKRGFGFVGPTICYAYMQAIGMVNDHTIDCFRHREIDRMTQRQRGRSGSSERGDDDA